VEFNVQGKVTLGSQCLIGAGCRFVDHDHGIEANTPIGDQSCETSPINLQDDVWLGANVVILKGVTIGSGAVVGTGAIVRTDVPAGEIWAGVPARKIGERT
jgi:acetyltransferase-like isoleucine patch superfamily enzyme